MVETDLLSCRNCFFLFNLFFLQVETFTEISGNNIIWERLCPVERDFPDSGKCFLLFRASFLQVETVAKTC